MARKKPAEPNPRISLYLVRGINNGKEKGMLIRAASEKSLT